MSVDFIPTEKLVKELQKRFDEMIFIAASSRTNETEDLVVSFSGSYHSCLGLVRLGEVALQSGASPDENYTD